MVSNTVTPIALPATFFYTPIFLEILFFSLTSCEKGRNFAEYREKLEWNRVFRGLMQRAKKIADENLCNCTENKDREVTKCSNPDKLIPVHSQNYGILSPSSRAPPFESKICDRRHFFCIHIGNNCGVGLFLCFRKFLIQKEARGSTIILGYTGR